MVASRRRRRTKKARGRYELLRFYVEVRFDCSGRRRRRSCRLG
jgi:hypothetical protein